MAPGGVAAALGLFGSAIGGVGGIWSGRRDRACVRREIDCSLSPCAASRRVQYFPVCVTPDRDPCAAKLTHLRRRPSKVRYR